MTGNYWMRYLTILMLCLLGGGTASALDFVQLRNGRIIEGAVIRQDTAAVFVTDWDQRHERFPSVQVYTRDEIAAIWFDSKPVTESLRSYVPETGLIELGGSAAMQTWAASVHQRRFFAQLSFIGAYTVIPQFGFEADADFMLPIGKEIDPIWDNMKFGHQFTLNVVAHPVTWKGMTPFALVGGGAAVDVPLGNLVLTTERISRNMVNFGCGVKWGAGKLGYRVEVRHAYYTWTPDEEIGGVRAIRQDADATTVKFGLFGFF